MKHSKKMTWAFFGALAFVMCAVGGLLVSTGKDGISPIPGVSFTPTPSDPSVGRVVGEKAAGAVPKGKATTTVPPKKVVAPVTISEGQWEVGLDVAPGKYRTAGAEKGLFELCIWTVKASDESDANVLDFGSANADEPGLVTLKKGQFFDTSGCENWTKR